jgi:hypothetical protein
MVHCKRPCKTPANADIPEVIHNPAEDAPAIRGDLAEMIHEGSGKRQELSETLLSIGFQKNKQMLKYLTKVILKENPHQKRESGDSRS